MKRVDFTIPINLVVRINDIDEDEIEDYVTDIMMAIDKIFYSDDPDDDHFEVLRCDPNWMKSYKETYDDED